MVADGSKTPTKKMSLYLDERLLLVIEYLAKWNRYHNDSELDTINKIIICRIQYFVEQLESNPDKIKDFISRTYDLDMSKLEARVLGKTLSGQWKPYPLTIPVELSDRFTKLCSKINKVLGFNIPKINIQNIVFLDYVMSIKDTVRDQWLEFINQDYFSPSLPKNSSKEDIKTQKIGINSLEESLQEKIRILRESDDEAQRKKADMLVSLVDLLLK